MRLSRRCRETATTRKTDSYSLIKTCRAMQKRPVRSRPRVDGKVSFGAAEKKVQRDGSLRRVHDRLLTCQPFQNSGTSAGNQPWGLLKHGGSDSPPAFVVQHAFSRTTWMRSDLTDYPRVARLRLCNRSLRRPLHKARAATVSPFNNAGQTVLGFAGADKQS
ncbi:hypothetical protein PUN28_003505 [Cardiocondyla obscurior]|uniref:Uncharacterized protein n=1 Tax=Cardiocondyla obscurior TaxID=286306 RepID=A0AAW2GNA1_9HYME